MRREVRIVGLFPNHPYLYREAILDWIISFLKDHSERIRDNGGEEAIQDEAVRIVPKRPLPSSDLFVCSWQRRAPPLLQWYIFISILVVYNLYISSFYPGLDKNYLGL